MQYSHIDKMEERDKHTAWIKPGVQVGDYVIFGRWKRTVTQDALDCDCGKAMFCPFIKEERI